MKFKSGYFFYIFLPSSWLTVDVDLNSENKFGSIIDFKYIYFTKIPSPMFCINALQFDKLYQKNSPFQQSNLWIFQDPILCLDYLFKCAFLNST